MNKANVDKTTLDGKTLYLCFIAGAQKIIEKKDHLNMINVFPVYDTDTGNNMASAMQTVINLVKPSEAISDMATEIADAALIGGHGNSGIIFSQMLYGFSSAFEHERSIGVHEFSNALSLAVRFAYEAIEHPVEGTMISVVKEWANSIDKLKDTIKDFDLLISNSYETASRALKETTKKLRVLARANVVDAGAQAFVFFIEGIIDYITKPDKRRVLNKISTIDLRSKNITHNFREINYRYCCEALIEGNEINTEEIRQVIAPLGDSMIVAGSSHKIKIHIHTGNPQELFARLSAVGTIPYQKVDDMKMQNEIAISHHEIALLTDSTFAIPKYLIDKYHIHVVHTRLNLNGSLYIDQLTMSPDRFFHLIKTNDKNYPTSASPSFKALTKKYNFLNQHYNSVIAFHVSGKLSATRTISTKAAHHVQIKTGMRIDVLNLEKYSAELILRTAEALKSGVNHDELLKKIEEWSKKIELVATSFDLSYAIRSGRLRYTRFLRFARHLKPVAGITSSGKQKLYGLYFSKNRALTKTIRKAIAIAKDKAIWAYSVTYTDNKEVAITIADEIEKYTGTAPNYINQLSPSIGSLVGPGGVAIVFMFQ